MSRPLRTVAVAAGLALLLAHGAHAQSANRSSAGAAALGQGKFDVAVKQLSAALNAPGLTPAQTAHALYQRGVAYRKLGQPSRAIADLSAALFLPSLVTGDKARAYINRSLAYKAAGLGDQAAADEAYARKLARREDVDRLMADPGNEAATAAATSVAPAPVRQAALPRPVPEPDAEGPASSQARQAGPAEAPPQQQAAMSDAPPRAGAGMPGMSVYSPAPPASMMEGAAETGDEVQGEEAQLAEAEQQSGAAPPAPAAEQTASVEPPPEPPAPPEPPQSISPPAFRDSIPAEQGRGAAQQSAPLRAARAAPSPAWQTSVDPQAVALAAPAEPEKSGNRFTRFFGSVWDKATGRGDEVKPDGAPLAATGAVPLRGSEKPIVKAAAKPEAGATAGSYRLQLASSRSEDEARQLWKRLSAANPELTSGREPQVDKTDLGSLGTVYRLHIGPFEDKAESLKVCNAFKRSGVDCFLVAR